MRGKPHTFHLLKNNSKDNTYYDNKSSNEIVFKGGGDAAHDADYDHDATGIASMEEGRSQRKDVWYTLQGVPLDGKPTVKGMYIVNGRKRRR